MTGKKQSAANKLWRAAKIGGVAAIAIGTTGAMGCLSRPLEPQEPRTTSTLVERLTQSAVDKIDLLLAIDNSRSMADKQQILALAVPDLVNGLVNPACINKETGDLAPTQPAGPLEDCADGFERDFEPVTDIHVGLISSSLGDYGADSCSPDVEPTNDDNGHLLERDAAGTGTVATYACKSTDEGFSGGCGFLSWDPEQSADPVGIADTDAYIASVTDLVVGAGQNGCGYEAQLESWYRFLVDPEPYESIELDDDGNIQKVGTDATILRQRADFMRPDSLLAIIMLTDENDCSVKIKGQFYIPLLSKTSSGSQFRMPRARSECATDPNDECCRSCRSKQDGCPDDPACASEYLTAEEDHINLRCFHQKQRFGIDFLYPTQRYVNALSQPLINPGSDDLSVGEGDDSMPNPLFMDLNENDNNSAIRDPGLVFFAGIVGVPWQDIARRDDSGPNLLAGLNAEGEAVGGFQTYDELEQNGVWDEILGDPANYVPPGDPLMRESVEKRSGTNPATGEALDTTGSNANSVNGHEYTISGMDDLQYACIFPLPAARDCSDPASVTSGCDCNTGTNDNPLCEVNPADPVDPTNRTQQTRAKAFPGLRGLEVLRGVQQQGVVASVCPAQVTDDQASDFGYRPAIGAIIDRLKLALGGQCLNQTLTPDAEGRVPCLVLEARNSQGQGGCNLPGRREVQKENQAAKDAVLEDDLADVLNWDTVCEIEQLIGDDGATCQDVLDIPASSAPDGWCYVDSTTVPQTGNPEIVADCPPNEKRLIRFVGEGEVQPGATLFITCAGE